ncbi:lipid A deacylase LpxR family protein [Dissulfurirhabdus thermomarina]|uniref:Lipid A deacylase LpxR family protein n=1 Tax=Dissulfurirhabdus thermomarina TaxID=1765737 RepID=A0A6N9TP70_DISTH|nr:lipid A deacylase LpxR family protein [Dissulfurirhabdus thermomarina]NDY41893.1 lipid A deacylase LpxR family protein [Dissulfurirhabdus thermomarina]NMX23709.1 lipid A deacylase LpxR family protein [Dissulfurirhabdus thermomarina]
MPRPFAPRRFAGRAAAVLGLVVLSVLAGAPRPARAGPAGVEGATWRLEFDNDVFLEKDNQISSGWSIQHHTAAARRWADVGGGHGSLGRLGGAIPTLGGEGLLRRSGIAVGQIIQTPDDVSRRDLIRDDVPYAAALTLQATWYAYDDEEFRGFEVTAGVSGPPALGEEVQKATHHLLGDKDPKGWNNQIETEPLLNLNYMRKRKVWHGGRPEGWSADAAVDGNVGLGNLFTQASVALELRLGRNMPGGFVYVPDPIGLSMHYVALLEPPRPERAALYASLVLRGTAFARNLFLDGTLLRPGPGVDKRPLVGMLIAGLHYERRDWGLHLGIFLTTDDVDTGQAKASEGHERLGTIDLEWRF